MGYIRMIRSGGLHCCSNAIRSVYYTCNFGQLVYHACNLGQLTTILATVWELTHSNGLIICIHEQNCFIYFLIFKTLLE